MVKVGTHGAKDNLMLDQVTGTNGNPHLTAHFSVKHNDIIRAISLRIDFRDLSLEGLSQVAAENQLVDTLAVPLRVFDSRRHVFVGIRNIKGDRYVRSW
jgi:hypothetical protein